MEQLFIHKPKSSPFILYFLSLLTVGVASLSLNDSRHKQFGLGVAAKQDHIKAEKDQIEVWFVVWVDLGLIFGWFCWFVAMGGTRLPWVSGLSMDLLVCWWVDLWIAVGELICGCEWIFWFVGLWSSPVMVIVGEWVVNGGGGLGWFCGVCLEFHSSSNGFGLIWIFGGCGLIWVSGGWLWIILLLRVLN